MFKKNEGDFATRFKEIRKKGERIAGEAIGPYIFDLVEGSVNDDSKTSEQNYVKELIKLYFEAMDLCGDLYAAIDEEREKTSEILSIVKDLKNSAY